MTGTAGDLSRRRVLQTAAGTAAAAAAGTALSGSAAAQDGEGVPAEYDGWFTSDARGGEVQNYDGTTVDRTGESEITVTVGADGNGGTFAFEPPAVRISPGTTVTFDWVSDTHNVLVESQPDDASWEGHEPIEDTGFTFTSTFETEGVYTYFCEPHLSLGMKGAIVVGPAPAGSGGGGGGEGVPADYGDWFTGDAPGGAVQNYDGTTTDRTGESEVTLTVGADGNGGTFAYEPPALRISPGTTVTFDWVSDTHNVLVESQPDDASWEGHEPIEDTGFSFSHTFETEGVYTYYCDPHLSLGMKGAIVVGPAPAGGDGGPGAAGGGGGGPPLWVTGLAGGALLALLAPVILSYYRYWDEDGGEGTAIPAGEPVPETADAEPVEEIGHDEYDPIGTAALIVVYALILLVMWVFMYFVEFLGNGPTVIG